MKVLLRTDEPTHCARISEILNTRDAHHPDAITLNWSRGNLKNGFGESFVEWVCQLDLSNVAREIAVSIVSSYLWDLMKALKSDPSVKDQSISIQASDSKKKLELKDVSDLASVEIFVGTCFDEP